MNVFHPPTSHTFASKRHLSKRKSLLRYFLAAKVQLNLFLSRPLQTTTEIVWVEDLQLCSFPSGAWKLLILIQCEQSFHCCYLLLELLVVIKFTKEKQTLLDVSLRRGPNDWIGRQLAGSLFAKRIFCAIYLGRIFKKRREKGRIHRWNIKIVDLNGNEEDEAKDKEGAVEAPRSIGQLKETLSRPVNSITRIRDVCWPFLVLLQLLFSSCCCRGHENALKLIRESRYVQNFTYNKHPRKLRQLWIKTLPAIIRLATPFQPCRRQNGPTNG